MYRTACAAPAGVTSATSLVNIISAERDITSKFKLFQNKSFLARLETSFKNTSQVQLPQIMNELHTYMLAVNNN